MIWRSTQLMLRLSFRRTLVLAQGDFTTWSLRYNVMDKVYNRSYINWSNKDGKHNTSSGRRTNLCLISSSWQVLPCISNINGSTIVSGLTLLMLSADLEIQGTRLGVLVSSLVSWSLYLHVFLVFASSRTKESKILKFCGGCSSIIWSSFLRASSLMSKGQL